MKYLIWSIEHGAWWRPAENGYTLKRADAGRYTLEKATEIVTGANEFIREGKPPHEAMVPDVTP